MPSFSKLRSPLALVVGASTLLLATGLRAQTPAPSASPALPPNAAPPTPTTPPGSVAPAAPTSTPAATAASPDASAPSAEPAATAPPAKTAVADPAENPETLPLIPLARASSAAKAGPSEPEDASTPGWFRVDSDLNGLSLWVGATHDLGGVGLATDVQVSSGAFPDIASGNVVPFSLAQFDVGPAFAFVDGAVAVTPMVGLQFDWYQRRTVALAAPQLFTILDLGPVYFESWVQCFVYGMFAENARIRDNFYTRNFLLYEFARAFALGPNVELTYLFDSRRVISLPVGGAAMLNYGKNSTLLVAMGYETDADARRASGGSGDRAVAGRFTFIQTW